MKLTSEQEEAVRAFATGDPIRVIAYAGSGKTSTLRAMAASKCRSYGLYVAFNKAIALEAGAKFGSSAQCRTAHSLAYRHIKGLGYSDDKMRTALSIRTCGRLSGGAVEQQAVLATVRRFCQSSDDAVCVKHVPPEFAARRQGQVDGAVMAEGTPTNPLIAGTDLSAHTSMAFRSAEQTFQGQPAVLPPGASPVPLAPRDPKDDPYSIAVADRAAALWKHQVDPRSPIPLGHDGYLKVWALSRPLLSSVYDYVMVDEAQDLNPVLVGVLAAQECQVISVGDSHQAIYSWRGAVDALEILPGRVCRLTQSFRFGGEIAAHARALLYAMGEEFPLRGNGGPGVVSEPDSSPAAILCRTNAGVIDVLLQKLKSGSRVYIPGGAQDLATMVDDASRLKCGYAAVGAELLGFRAWRQVQEYADTDDGASLRVLVGLVEKYGCEALRGALAHVLQRADPGSVTVSTVHKAKGLEWPDVEIHTDFVRPEVETVKGPSMEERRLFYVACTRAQSDLLVRHGTAMPFLT